MSGSGPLGFIADDITGATDLASALAARGLDVRIVFGTDAVSVEGADVVVVALKIRSIPAAVARSAAEVAAVSLRAAGARQLFSKYCSTFDSTPAGNIGPIVDGLADLTGARRVVHSPAYPANARTVYLGHLFVGNELLSDSPMRDHPLNPMRESRLSRVLGEQTPHTVHGLTLPVVQAGADAVAGRLAEIADQSAAGHHVIVDAVRDSDLETIARAVAGDRLAAGSAAFGAAFAAAALERSGGVARSGRPPRPRVPEGPAAVLAGSLSTRTRTQVREFDGPTLNVRVADLADEDAAVGRALDFAADRLASGAVLITTDHADVRGLPTPGTEADEAPRRVERMMGRVARGLAALGVRRLVVAGGETSGAVADALALRSARVGPDISVGVPWIVAEDRGLAVAFKSGNFGGPAFFRDALAAAER